MNKFSLFEIIDAMYEVCSDSGSTYTKYDTSMSQFLKIDDKSKKDNFFIINRRMAIKYPIQAAKLATYGVNPIYGVDSWYLITSRHKKNSKPPWHFTKIEKSATKKISINESVKEYYKKLNNITERQFQEALKFEPAKMARYLKDLQKYLKTLS